MKDRRKPSRTNGFPPSATRSNGRPLPEGGSDRFSRAANFLRADDTGGQRPIPSRFTTENTNSYSVFFSGLDGLEPPTSSLYGNASDTPTRAMAGTSKTSRLSTPHGCVLVMIVSHSYADQTRTKNLGPDAPAPITHLQKSS